jgi:hypothetical protein
VLGLFTSVRHPQRAIALHQGRKQLSPHRPSQQTLALSARGGPRHNVERSLLSWQPDAGGTDPGFKHKTPLRASGGPTECQLPDMKAAAGSGDSGDVVQTRCRSRHVEAQACGPRLDRCAQAVARRNAEWTVPLVSFPTPSRRVRWVSRVRSCRCSNTDGPTTRSVGCCADPGFYDIELTDPLGDEPEHEATPVHGIERDTRQPEAGRAGSSLSQPPRPSDSQAPGWPRPRLGRMFPEVLRSPGAGAPRPSLGVLRLNELSMRWSPHAIRSDRSIVRRTVQLSFGPVAWWLRSAHSGALAPGTPRCRCGVKGSCDADACGAAGLLRRGRGGDSGLADRKSAGAAGGLDPYRGLCWSASALPPPRRTGSAIASARACPSICSAVASPG